MFDTPFAILAVAACWLPQQAWPPHPPVFSGYLLGIEQVQHAVSADLDGDGNLDLATLDGSDIRTHLGTGSGAFVRDALPPVSLPSGVTLRGSSSGDFDGDGDPDLAVIADVSNQGRIYTWLNDGSGVLSLHTTLQYSWPLEKLSAVDLNADGWVDLVMLRSPGPKLQILRSRGPAGFAAQPWITPPTGWLGVHDFAAADLTGDGWIDVLALTWGIVGKTPTAFLYANDGVGGLLPPVAAFEFELWTQRVLVADLRGDGVLHAGTVRNQPSHPPTLYWFENDGLGKFEYRQRIDDVAFPDSEPRDLAVRDLDGDGREEWVVERPSGTYARVVAEGPGLVLAEEELITPAGPWLAAGDFDSDGAEDLLTSLGLGDSPIDLAVLPGDGMGGLNGMVASPDLPGWYAPRLLDYDGDGRLDVAVPDQLGKEVRLHRGLGDGRFELDQKFPTRDRPLEVAVADFDGDGRPDLGVKQGPQSFVELFLQDERGSFTSVGATLPEVTPFSYSYGPLHPIDSDGDGRDELALMDWARSRVLFVGLGAAQRTVILGKLDLPGAIGIHGVTDPAPDGSQALELIATGTASYLSLWVLGKPLALPPPTLVERLALPLQPPAPGVVLWPPPLVRDEDGDGAPEVWAMYRTEMSPYGPYGNSSSAVWHGLTSGGFAAPESERSPFPLWPVLAEDVDGDGAIDRGYEFYGSATGNPYAVRLQIHRPALGVPLAEPESYPWTSSAHGDVNGDGRMDLVVIRSERIVSLLNLSGR